MNRKGDYEDPKVGLVWSLGSSHREGRGCRFLSGHPGPTAPLPAVQVRTLSVRVCEISSVPGLWPSSGGAVASVLRNR